MKPYTCFSTRMDVAGVGQLTEGNSLSPGVTARARVAMRWRSRQTFKEEVTYRVCLFVFMVECRSAPAPKRSGLSRNGLNLPPVYVLIISEWCRGFVRKMASVIFIQLRSTSSFSLGLRVAMATPAVQSVQAEDDGSTEGPVYSSVLRGRWNTQKKTDLSSVYGAFRLCLTIFYISRVNKPNEKTNTNN